jgi:hypothetical protein
MPLAERLLDCFPCGTYALPALLRLLDIVESREVATAAVECRAEPRLFINPEFVARWAATPEKLLMLVMHELHHVLLGHTRLFPRVTAVDNLVFDAIINSLLCRMFPAQEHVGFFTDLYDEARFPDCLLRPPAGWSPLGQCSLPVGLRDPRLREVAEVYRALYAQKGAGYHELYDALRRLVSEELAKEVALLGDHRSEAPGESSSGGLLEERSPLLFEIVRAIVEDWPQPPDPIAGRSLADLLRDASVPPRHQSSNRLVLRQLLRRVGGRDRGDGRRWARLADPATILTPLPTLDRRSVVLRALGAEPLLHHGSLALPRRIPTSERVHVYLDVSGSIGGLKGALYGAVLDCREFVLPVVHLFSTEVADVSLGELRAGVCRTTWGTSIDCVARHMDARRVRRAVIITDGYVGRPTGGVRDTLCRACLGVALTPGNSRRDDLAEVANYWCDLSD